MNTTTSPAPDIYAEVPEDSIAYKIAVMAAYAAGQRLEIIYAGKWCDWLSVKEKLGHSISTPSWNWASCKYRIGRPKVRVPLTMEDFGMGSIWLFHKEYNPTQIQLAVGIDIGGVTMGSHGTFSSYSSLMHSSIQWSSDRKNWKPCYKEE